MTIPFIRGNRDGSHSLAEIARSPEIEHMAHRFIALDGRLLIETLDDGAVRLTAIIDVDGGAKDIAGEVVENGPKLPEAVDRVVIACDEFLNRRPQRKVLMPTPGELAVLSRRR